MELLSHKGYHGSIETSLADKVLHGKILFVGDLVTYEAENISQLEDEFVAAVDDYLETCNTVGKAPQKTCNGQFNVRIPPELHRLAQIRAASDATNLNAVATKALENYLKGPTKAGPTVTYSETEASYSAAPNVINFNDYERAGASTALAFTEATNSSSSSVFTLKTTQPMEQEYAH
jgi:predicted HicB family RNase H-like nuclease